MWHLRCNGFKLHLSQYVNVGMQLIHMFLGCVTCCQPVFGSRYDLVYAHKKREEERGSRLFGAGLEHFLILFFNFRNGVYLQRMLQHRLETKNFQTPSNAVKKGVSLLLFNPLAWKLEFIEKLFTEEGGLSCYVAWKHTGMLEGKMPLHFSRIARLKDKYLHFLFCFCPFCSSVLSA